MPEPTLPDDARDWIEREAAHGTETVAYKISRYQAGMRIELHRARTLLSLAQGSLSLAAAGRDACGYCGHPKDDHENPVASCTRRECHGDPHAYSPAIILVPVSVIYSFDPGSAHHFYLSTGCLHGRHDYCQGETGAVGPKTPGECKFCSSPCVCPCHVGGG